MLLLALENAKEFVLLAHGQTGGIRLDTHAHAGAGILAHSSRRLSPVEQANTKLSATAVSYDHVVLSSLTTRLQTTHRQISKHRYAA